ncbi:TPA: hypothetical protein OQU49_004349 [Shigella flexneri]|nr:hypothetical protein [Shigella flexneri]
MSLTIKRARKSVPLCTNLALKSEHDRAVAAFEDAKSAAARDSRETSTTERDAALEVFRLEQEMKKHTVQVELEALPRKQWAEFEVSSPAREGNDTDKTYGLDLSKLDEAIMPSIVGVTSADGETVPFEVKDWPALADEMSQSQWEAFALATLGLNRGSTAPSFSPAASLAILRSEPTFKRPNDSE